MSPVVNSDCEQFNFMPTNIGLYSLNLESEYLHLTLDTVDYVYLSQSEAIFTHTPRIPKGTLQRRL